MKNTNQPITRDTHVTSRLVPESERMDFVDKLFGLHYVLRLEPTVFQLAEHLAAPQYNGGYWQFYGLSNGGFYMALRSDAIFSVSCENGFEGQMTADALGISSCLYAFSQLSFGDGAFAETCANHYHWLREFAMDHAEVRSILRAIDRYRGLARSRWRGWKAKLKLEVKHPLKADNLTSRQRSLNHLVCRFNELSGARLLAQRLQQFRPLKRVF